MNTPLYIPVLEERKKFKDYRQDIWGDSFDWYRLRSWDTIRYIVFHHSVTKPTNNSKADVDYIAELHRRRGWGGIGYHFVITSDGMVWYVGDISVQRANVADKNHLVIGICMVGDFTASNPTDEQILSAHDLAKYLINDVPVLVNVKREGWKAVVGHKELQATQCPGTYWKGVSDSIYERIKNRIPYTPQPQPEPEVDWQKKFKDLEIIFRNEKKKWDSENGLMIEAKDKLMRELADYKIECEEEKISLNKIIKDLKSANPQIPTIEDFSDKVVIRRTLQIIVSKLKWQSE